MKISTMAAAFILLTSLSFFSCKKEEDQGKLPNIAFKTGAGYTSSDVTVTAGDTLLAGINASKAEEEDVLVSYDVSYSYDGGASTPFYDESLSGSDQDNYSHDTQIITRSTAGTEKWTFTVTNRDGLSNSVSFTVTTQ